MNDQLIIDTLELLHKNAEADSLHRSAQRKEEIAAGATNVHHWGTAYMAVGKPEGEFLYFIANVSRAKHIVEFGCSFGISTIYLAAAAKNNDGHVITTDFEPAKVEGATQNIANAGLQNYVTILAGDAMETLATVKNDINLLFLDGAKDLYLPVFNMLLNKLKKGAVILADNADKKDVHEFNQLLTSSKDRFITSFLFEGRLLVATCI